MADDTHGGAVLQQSGAAPQQTDAAQGPRPGPAFLTPKQLQAELQIGERLAYRLLKSGQIPSIRIGGVYRIPRSRLDELGRQA